MGLWPFGRAKADVESGSRVVVLRARDGVPMRAKVTLRLVEPQTQAAVDDLTEQCADLARLVVREAPSANAVLGLEQAIATEVAARMPKEPVLLRGVEIVGLHIVGDPGHAVRPPAMIDENPAWLHAAPSPAAAADRGLDRLTPIQPLPAFSDRGLDRLTPIQPLPAVRMPGAPPSSAPVSSSQTPPPPTAHSPGVSPPHGHAPASSLSQPPVSSAPSRPSAAPPAHGPLAPRVPAVTSPARPQDPNASTAVSPSTFAQPPRAPEPTPHTGIPTIRKAQVGDHAPPQVGDPAGERAQVHAGDHRAGDPALHPSAAAEPHDPAHSPPRDPFASTAVSAGPSFGATDPRRTDAPPPAINAGSMPPPPAINAGSMPSPPHSASPGSMPPRSVNAGSAPPTHRPGSSPPIAHTPAAQAFSRPLAAGGARPPSGSMPAVGARATGVPSPPDESSSPSRRYTGLTPDEPSSPSRRYAGLGPSSAGSPPSMGPRSRASSRPPPAAVAARRRVVASRLFLPAGAGPYEVARGLTPLFRDTAGRILVAFLRTYDLTVVRRVPFDAVEGDILASLTAPSDGAPGTYAASHAAEIQRWRDGFGAATMEKLQREANLAAAALAFEGLTGEGVAHRDANAVVEGLAGAAFGDPEMILELGRYLFPANETTAAETLANMIEVAGEGMPPGLESALEPLFTSLREDVTAAALLAKEVMTSV